MLDSTLSFNEHIQCVKKKVSKILGLFSRIRPLLTVQSANRIYKVMVLSVLDYCDIVFHECGQGNQDELERLQRRASRIVYRNSGLLSTNDIIDKLGWETLNQRRENHVLKAVQKCIDNEVPNYMSDYFKVKLECTKRAFFYKGAKIYNSVNH